jgi:uncharacterized membrane protein YphA (DoxX/SURF4 family)
MSEPQDPYAAPDPQQPGQQPPAPPPGQPQPGYPPQGYPQGYPQQPNPQGYPPPAPPQGYPTPNPAAGYPPGTYPPGYGVAPGYGEPTRELPKGLAIAALVVGIIAALGFWFPVIGALLGLVAVVIGIIAWRNASNGTASGQGMAIAGTILGALALIGGILVTILTIWVFSNAVDCIDPNLTDAQIQRCLEDQFNN